MKRSLASQWMASLLAAALIIVPATVTAQGQTPQQAPPQSQQSPAPSGQPTPPTTQAPSAPETQSTPDAGSSSSASAPVSQQNSPNVKSGSEADVDAIGNRKVGHGPELYSLEHDIAIGKQLSQEVEKSAKFIDDPVVTEYVNRVG
jgi:predicted Zn-dependent protease